MNDPPDPRYRERVERARLMTGEEKVREGLRLSELALEIMADGIRGQHPGASEEELQQLLCERVDTLRALGRR
jgi:hypothetical protein